MPSLRRNDPKICQHDTKIITNLFKNNTHPNIKIIEKEIDSKTGKIKSNITIDQIRRFDAIEGDTYVYTLDSIDEIDLESTPEEDFQRNEFAKSAVINIEDSLLMEQLRSNASIKLGNLL